MTTEFHGQGGDVQGDERQTQRFHIFTDPADPDVFLVVRDGSGPLAIPVIPTTMAVSYWVHPSWIAATEVV